ncbi:hypothetical protein KC207_01160 [Phycicoccus sp. BSK3Z-2]|uniref:Uncharacterized protein n=1 Tax=Phycicoccus avicenniae TaxID=2828860 RepID=A0A941D6X4_9MICO|nr:hypothetical protein [Phycicoccus avicenniae]MBR7741900.1 hypothetical protein [Phycicoccus avicenniae]
MDEVTTEAVPETRAARRARREALLRSPLMPAMATVPRPVVVAVTVVLSFLLVAAVRTDAVLVAAGLAWMGLLLAWGWPRLLGSSSRFGSTLAVAVGGVLAPVAAVLPDGRPTLRFVPVALAVGLGFMFGHQIARRDGRPRLTESIGVSSFGLALVALGTTWLPLLETGAAAEVALVGFVGVAVGSLADLAVGVTRLRPWLLPVAMVLGGSGALVAASVVGGPPPAVAALTGLLVAAVSHALRRVLSVLPPLTAIRCQVAAAAAGVLLPGVVAYGVGLVLVG